MANDKKFTDWRCGSCNALLGLIYPDNSIAIKYKSLYMWCKGYIKTTCRKCLYNNEINTYTTIEDLLIDYENSKKT